MRRDSRARDVFATTCSVPGRAPTRDSTAQADLSSMPVQTLRSHKEPPPPDRIIGSDGQICDTSACMS